MSAIYAADLYSEANKRRDARRTTFFLSRRKKSLYRNLHIDAIQQLHRYRFPCPAIYRIDICLSIAVRFVPPRIRRSSLQPVVLSVASSNRDFRCALINVCDRPIRAQRTVNRASHSVRYAAAVIRRECIPRCNSCITRASMAAKFKILVAHNAHILRKLSARRDNSAGQVSAR